MTEHLLDLMLTRAASVLGLGLIVARIALRSRRAALAWIGGVLVAIGTLGHLLIGTLEIAGVLSLGSIADVVRNTAFGSAAGAGIGTGALLVVASVSARSTSRVASLLAVTAAVAFALALSAQGHAAEPHGRTFVHAVHLGAASLWTGGLVALADAVERGDVEPRTVVAFGRLALGLVIVLFATGFARARDHLVSVADLVGPYGRVLVLKVGLAASALAFAFRHRRRTLPEIARGGEIPWTFGRDLTAELVLVFCTLLAATALAQQAPPRD